MVRPYTPSSVGTVYSNPTLSPYERSVGARAVLRADHFDDGDHLSVRKPHGLHPAYIALHSLGKGSELEKSEVTTLLEKTSRDILNAVSPTKFPIL
jgi:hypothetical protein